MHTETEAQTKWCPMVRETSVAVDEHSAVSLGNRYIDRAHPDREYHNPVGCRCIASACMMWRWNLAFAKHSIKPENELGYCGLAGRPEVV